MDSARKKALMTGSLGLIGMQERAQLAGGRLAVSAAPGSGTTVQLTFALDPADQTAIGNPAEPGVTAP